MIIGGRNQSVVNGTGGLGLRVNAFARPDLAPSGPGYIDIIFGSGSATPAQPYFISVTSTNGTMSVRLGCNEAVDGYELAVSATNSPPLDGAASLYSASGEYSFPAVSGDQYLHARTVRDGLRSGWVSYGGPTSGQDEWTTVYENNPFSGTNYQEYSGCAEVTGWTVRYTVESGIVKVRVWNTVYDTGDTLGLLTDSDCRTNINGTSVQAEIECKSDIGSENFGTGAILLARAAAILSYATESFYVMFYATVNPDQVFGDNDQRIVLGKYVNGAYSEIARSANLYPAFMPLGSSTKAFNFKVVGNTFSCEIGGVKCFEHTDASIPAAADRNLAGMILRSEYGQQYRFVSYLKVQAKSYGAEPVAVDAGQAVDLLKQGNLQSTFALSQNVLLASGNDTADCVKVRLDDTETLVAEVYAEDGTRRAAKDKVISVDGHTHPMDAHDHSSASTGGTTLQADVDQFLFGFVTDYAGAQQTTISFDGTNTFTIAPTGTVWTYYRNGLRHTITGSKTVTLSGSPPAATGLYFIYLDSTDGTLTAATGAWTLEDSKVPVAVLAWNNGLTPKYWLADERHSVSYGRRNHLEHHFADGTEIVGDIPALSGYTVTPASPADANNTFAIAASTLYDEDLKATLAGLADPDGTSADYVVFFRTGAAAWSWEASAMPYRYTAAGYIQYDNAGSMAEGTHQKFYNTYLLLTNIAGAARHVIVHGQSQFASLAAAQAENFAALTKTSLPVSEYVAVYQLTWETGSSYGTKGKARLAAAPRSIYVAGIAKATTGTGGSGNLSELGDVSLASLTAGDVLLYDSGLAKWKNAQPTAGGGAGVLEAQIFS